MPHQPTTRLDDDPAFSLHRGGKVGIAPRVSVRTPADLALAYTPGVGRVSQAIADDPSQARHYTGRANSVAVLTNGTAVLGLGDIGPQAAMPVMEGKAILFHRFAGIDAYPICLDARTPDEVVAVAKALAPTFGGINLEDIAAPDCFEIERRLQDELDIPVFHDDQHGTAIVVGAAVTNVARLTERALSDLRVVVVGVGAAGTACGRLIHDLGVADVVAVDRVGILHRDMVGLPEHHRWFADHANRDGRRGGVREALRGADVLIGVSGPGTIDPTWLAEMNPDAAVFAMANPVPEVLPSQVPDNVAVVGTGRSDFPNQINNVLAFPGVFRGLLDAGATQVTPAMKRAAATVLADLVDEPTPDRIVPGVFDPGVADAVAAAIRAVATGPASSRPAIGAETSARSLSGAVA